MKAMIVIPARYGSERLPGKVLLEVKNKPIIQYVYENAKKSSLAEIVVIATDSEKVFQSCEKFGAAVEMTSIAHRSGTERVAEVAKRHPEYDLIINLQGDEPEMPAKYLDQLIECLSKRSIPTATLASKIEKEEEIQSPHVVKVILNKNMDAIYFSRSVIPYPRNLPQKNVYYRHLGIYGFQRDFLLKLVSFSPTPLEMTESLEQLRILENGYSIGVELVPLIPPGIDTQADFDAFKKRIEER
jgi:3-deoxy-manno-octulosonate cytidylyltransferase (CMP-KDO synthetase)